MNKWSTIGYIFIAFACAITLWFFVADYDRITEVEIKNVKVDLILPSNENLSVESGLNNYITVKVSGRKADVEGMSAKDLHAYIDLSGIKSETNRAFDVQFDKLPEGVTVVNGRDIPKITVVLVEPVVKDFPIVANIKYDIALPNFIQTSCVPASVKIMGSASIIDSIATAEISEDVGTIEGDHYVLGNIVLRDDKGNIIPQTYLDLDGTEAKVYIDVFTKKELDVEVRFIGGIYTADTSGAEIKCEPSKVTVVGPLKSLEAKDCIYVEIDERQILDSDYTCTVDLPDLSQYVNVEYEGELQPVEVSIKNSLITSTILDVHKEDIFYAEIGDYVIDITGIRVNDKEYGDSASVMFLGLRQSVANLSAQKLNLEIDIEAIIEENYELLENGETLALTDIRLTKPYTVISDIFTSDELYVSLEISSASGSENSVANDNEGAIDTNQEGNV